MQLNAAPAALLALILIALIVAIGAKILNASQTAFYQSGSAVIQNQTTAIASNATISMGEFANFMPIIGVTLAAALIIGVVVVAFAFKD